MNPVSIARSNSGSTSSTDGPAGQETAARSVGSRLFKTSRMSPSLASAAMSARIDGNATPGRMRSPFRSCMWTTTDRTFATSCTARMVASRIRCSFNELEMSRTARSRSATAVGSSLAAFSVAETGGGARWLRSRFTRLTASAYRRESASARSRTSSAMRPATPARANSEAQQRSVSIPTPSPRPITKVTSPNEDIRAQHSPGSIPSDSATGTVTNVYRIADGPVTPRTSVSGSWSAVAMPAAASDSAIPSTRFISRPPRSVPGSWRAAPAG